MLYLLIHRLAKEGKLDALLKRDGVIPNSCKAVLVKLNHHIPQNWHAACDKTDLKLVINLGSTPRPEKIEQGFNEEKHIKMYSYRQLANNLVSLAQIAPEDTLSKVPVVHVMQITQELSLEAVGVGFHVVKLATIPDSRLIAEQLKATIRVREIVNVQKSTKVDSKK